MPLFDQDKIIKLISELRNHVNQLNRLKQVTEIDFLNDTDKIGSTKYHFIVAIECCIDICQHIIARNGYPIPENYSDVFKIIGNQGAFNENQTETFIKMAKFRNRLVHLYWEVDDHQVYNILQKHLNDFDFFLKEILTFLHLEDK